MVDSFKVDHVKLSKGVYLQSVKEVGASKIRTYDIRLENPRGFCLKTRCEFTPMTHDEAHILEHLLAVELRKDTQAVLYVGPMGCMTGFYVITVDLESEKFVNLLRQALGRIIGATSIEVPANDLRSCGNPVNERYLSRARAGVNTILEAFIDTPFNCQQSDEDLKYPEEWKLL